jgi:SAM-dependent methyltransferase
LFRQGGVVFYLGIEFGQNGYCWVKEVLERRRTSILIKFLQKNRLFREIIYQAGRLRAKGIVGKIQPSLDKGDTILDIGSGTGNVCEILSKRGYKITPLDVRDLSFVDSVRPVIYDGNKIPFGDEKFDKSLILTVLHHAPEPEKILQEAKRVSRKIIIIEDVYSNSFHKWMTYFFDSLLNLEFVGHPPYKQKR